MVRAGYGLELEPRNVHRPPVGGYHVLATFTVARRLDHERLHAHLEAARGLVEAKLRSRRRRDRGGGPSDDGDDRTQSRDVHQDSLRGSVARAESGIRPAGGVPGWRSGVVVTSGSRRAASTSGRQNARRICRWNRAVTSAGVARIPSSTQWPRCASWIATHVRAIVSASSSTNSRSAIPNRIALTMPSTPSCHIAVCSALLRLALPAHPFSSRSTSRR